MRSEMWIGVPCVMLILVSILNRRNHSLTTVIPPGLYVKGLKVPAYQLSPGFSPSVSITLHHKHEVCKQLYLLEYCLENTGSSLYNKMTLGFFWEACSFLVAYGLSGLLFNMAHLLMGLSGLFLGTFLKFICFNSL